MMTLDALCDTVPLEMVSMIIKKDTTKEARDVMAAMRVSDDCVKKATMQQLDQKFNFTMFDDGEIVKDYALRLSGMAAHLATLEKDVKDGKTVAKMLRSLLPHLK
jgi:hypothetical protein